MAFHDDPQGHTAIVVNRWYAHRYAHCSTHWAHVLTRTAHGLCEVLLWAQRTAHHHERNEPQLVAR